MLQSVTSSIFLRRKRPILQSLLGCVFVYLVDWTPRQVWKGPNCFLVLTNQLAQSTLKISLSWLRTLEDRGMITSIRSRRAKPVFDNFLDRVLRFFDGSQIPPKSLLGENLLPLFLFPTMRFFRHIPYLQSESYLLFVHNYN